MKFVFPSPRLSRAFTLTELLVTLAILTLLIGLVVPAVGGARRKAKEVSRAVELRQLAVSIEVFSGAANEQYPYYGGLTPGEPFQDPKIRVPLAQEFQPHGPYFFTGSVLWNNELRRLDPDANRLAIVDASGELVVDSWFPGFSLRYGDVILSEESDLPSGVVMSLSCLADPTFWSLRGGTRIVAGEFRPQRTSSVRFPAEKAILIATPLWLSGDLDPLTGLDSLPASAADGSVQDLANGPARGADLVIVNRSSFLLETALGNGFVTLEGLFGQDQWD